MAFNRDFRSFMMIVVQTCFSIKLPYFDKSFSNFFVILQAIRNRNNLFSVVFDCTMKVGYDSFDESIHNEIRVLGFIYGYYCCCRRVRFITVI